MLPSSFLKPNFSMDLRLGDRVFYTSSGFACTNGLASGLGFAYTNRLASGLLICPYNRVSVRAAK